MTIISAPLPHCAAGVWATNIAMRPPLLTTYWMEDGSPYSLGFDAHHKRYGPLVWKLDNASIVQRFASYLPAGKEICTVCFNYNFAADLFDLNVLNYTYNVNAYRNKAYFVTIFYNKVNKVYFVMSSFTKWKIQYLKLFSMYPQNNLSVFLLTQCSLFFGHMEYSCIKQPQ